MTSPAPKPERHLRAFLVRGMFLGWLISSAVFFFASFFLRPTHSAALFDDTHAYIDGAARLLATGTPYADVRMPYLYPPVFAQLISPLLIFGDTAATVILGVLLGAMLPIAVWIVSRGHEIRRRVAVLLLTVPLFLPAIGSTYLGNVPGLLALVFTMALVSPQSAGLGLGIGTLVKLVPAAGLPAAALRAPRATLFGLLALAPVVLLSVVMAPTAWSEWLDLLTSQATRGNPIVINLAPPGHFILAIFFGGMSLVLARRDWPAALACAACAALLSPASYWPDYNAMLAPFLAFAFLNRRGHLPFVALVLLALPVWPAALAGMITLVLGLQVKHAREPGRVNGVLSGAA